ncbi:accessory gene regulator B family protein [Clostridium sp. FP2]|uniref:accessory gene regulator B family protein n=1 Tax=Clostridium sp. FP2 TaxID=2724481 RepID=UPI0013E928AC|nr:accessory gene regulator B family protein [Clostridium sp. FP2]MBZ9626162.1 accessory gene regulator B family protein [Clostridium sp. FP2]
MDFIAQFSSICTDFIRKNSVKSEVALEKIQYGLHVLFINIIELFILFLTAYFLGVFQYTVIAFSSFALLRTFASGIHASSTIWCITVNYILFLGNTYLSLYLKTDKFLISIVFILSFLLMFKYAPADTAERPLISVSLRKKLKKCSLSMVVILYIVTWIKFDTIYINLITFSVLTESILITPAIYKLFRKEYRNYDKYKD